MSVYQRGSSYIKPKQQTWGKPGLLEETQKLDAKCVSIHHRQNLSCEFQNTPEKQTSSQLIIANY